MTLKALPVLDTTLNLPPRRLPDTVVLPFGEFVSFPGHLKNSRTPPELRNLPVLRGIFNHERFDFDPILPSHLKVTAFAVAAVKVICFQFQHGPNVLCWHACAADPYVWRALDQWSQAGAFLVLADFSNGESVHGGNKFAISPAIEGLRAELANTEGHIPLFREYIADGILHDQLWRAAASSIPQYPTLEQVQSCLVTTPHTGPLVWASNVWLGSPFAKNLLCNVSPPRFHGQA